MNIIAEKLRAYLNRGTFARSVAVLAGGTALGQGIVVLASPILTRLYTPEDFGVLSVFVSLFSILLIMNSLRYEVAIPMAETEQGAANLLALVLLLVILTTAIFALVLGLWGDVIFERLNAEELQPYSWLLVLSLLFGGIYQALNFWGIRKQAFDKIANSKLTQNGGMVLLQLGFGFLMPTTGGLLSGIAAGQVTGNIPLLRLAWMQDRHLLSHIRLQAVLNMANRYRRFPLWTSWSSFLNTAGVQLPAILVVSIYGAQIGGWFSLSQRIIGLPMALIGVSVAQVYVSRAAQLARDDPAALYPLFMRTARRLLWVGILPIGFLALTGPWLFAFIFGEQWRTTGEYVQLMAPLYLVHFVVSSLGQNIYVIERQDIQSLWDAARMLLLLGVFGLGSAWNLDAYVTIGLYTVSMLLAYLVIFVLNIYALKKFAADRAG